ncbi:MAG: efflux transporter periplasmic adaptor subunit [Phenylobacterium sp.]|nr:efflux transporter periplasmic adaptor subunit [Phenylobacterium sp.]
MSPNPTTRRRARLSRPLMVVLGVVALVVVAAVAWQMRPKTVKDPYRTAAVEQGAITKSVSASGSLQALITVDVGSQISGQIRDVRVDFNDQVRKGQVLAVLDPQTYQTRVAQGQADVQAGVAALRQAEAQVANAKADYDRKNTLVAKGIYAPSALDTATAAYKTGVAGVSAARAKIAQSQAALNSQRVDLGRTTIVSPIDGVVVDRKVQPGNTVAASLQAPVLFTIAQDLSKVEVKISVDEADVGQVREGQMVRFTVDAYPDDTFEGVVTQVRKQPTTEQNVVAYTVIAEADNPNSKLLPGMTANADIVIETRPHVLKVPAAALRWSPPSENNARTATAVGGPPGFGGPSAGGRPGGGGGGGGGGQRGGGLNRVAEQLDLDAGQKKAWEAIQADQRPKMMAAFAAAGGDRKQAGEAMRKIREESFAKLDPLLKPAQKTKLVALRATMAQARGGRGGGMTGGVVYVLKDGKPSPVPVRVGATDGTNTQIVGPLKAGDQVITGGGPKPKAKAGGTPFGGQPAGGPGGGQRRGGGF